MADRRSGLPQSSHLTVDWVNGGNPAGDSLNAAAQSTINAVSTGTHALLGAELCRITNDTGYCDKALASAQWLDRHMIAHDGYLFDNLDLKTCAITDWKFTCEPLLLSDETLLTCRQPGSLHRCIRAAWSPDRQRYRYQACA